MTASETAVFGSVPLMLLALGAACASAPASTPQQQDPATARPKPAQEVQVAQSDCAKYFPSIEEAVPAITVMLHAERWAELACYYDLSGSEVDRAELESGRFFLRPDDDRPRHPGGLDRIRHPFAPGFRYASHQRVGPDAVVEVEIQIDQGGGMVQHGLQRFVMRESEAGWQVRPETAPEPEAPSAAPASSAGQPPVTGAGQ